jgi:tol-pal system protein YbgF
VLSSCITPGQFHVLERDVDALKTHDGRAGAAERLDEIDREIERFRDQLAAIQGQVEEARRRAEQALAEAGEARRIGLASRGPELVRRDEIPLIPRAHVPAPPGAVDGASAAFDREVQDYENAFRLYSAGDYETAVTRFQTFLQTYPASDYADNALFWIGECHQKLGDLVLAAVTFERVHKQFPKGNKVPDALYRQAVALVEIGRQRGESKTYEAAAREVLLRIVDEYPRSERADEARRMLEKLRS